MSALLLAVLAALLLTGSQPALAQHPEESHCGTEASGSGNNGFVNHAQLSRTLASIELSLIHI